jgi:hypothetical protein
VSQCHFSGNTTLASGDGAALWASFATSGTGSATVSVTNSTFYKNVASNDGGALWFQNSNTGMGTNTVTLTSLTVAYNTANGVGGGVWIDPGMTNALAVEFWNSIVAKNTSNTNHDDDDVFGKGTVFSKEHNLIGNVDGSSGWTGNDYQGHTAQPLDPRLNAPARNGGLTPTMTLQNNSPAYRNGDATNLGGTTTDQRGYTRQRNFVPGFPR